ncbi:hypothetical protein CEXT_124311 [Caerostris extrusa]|uniref:Uncharacterized protein n=1 Tax=Caerostris extrusa TaxID=172846 RepID=A0AAV4MAC9_CAEEX|nr:hypothetical protein CEXT_124311 [Caerostris extrusa]
MVPETRTSPHLPLGPQGPASLAPRGPTGAILRRQHMYQASILFLGSVINEISKGFIPFESKRRIAKRRSEKYRNTLLRRCDIQKMHMLIFQQAKWKRVSIPSCVSALGYSDG